MAIKCPKCQYENPDDTIYCGKCALPLKPVEEFSATKTLETPVEKLTRGALFADRYEIIEELGKGGMGKVYRAFDTEAKEEVALKLINPEIAQDKAIIERFRNELKIARKISHRNICRMHDIGKAEEGYFITMEYVEGKDLKNLIRKKGKLSIDEVIGIIQQICEGLAEAHELGVVHRDLKPQNIMIDDKGKAKIMDFGIARSVESAGVTQTGVMIGTPDYISPEQAEGEEADQRSDIYSLGVILYEMVTGSVPFKGDTALSVALKHKAQIPRDPKKFNPDISDDLNRLILICMEKNRNNRYQSAAELLADLKNIKEGFPLETKILSRRATLVPTFIRKKLFIFALVITTCLIAIVIWQFLPKKETDTLISVNPSIAVLPFVDLSPQEDQAYFCDGLADELINRLTKIENLRVPARTSSFSFKGKGLDIKEIGKKLDVENVLEGSIRRSNSRLRITVQLVKVEDGYPIWSEKYDRSVEDIFALQDDISLAIIDNLKIELLGKEKTELVMRHTQNLEAYELYLKGQFFRSKRTEESLKKSVEYFEEAIKIDPFYALAHAELAYSYGNLATWGFLSSKEAYAKAREAALRAVELGDTLAETHLALAGFLKDFDWDWEGAEREFVRAIELNPRYPTTHLWYAEYLDYMGQFDKALEEIELAKKLDPLDLIIHADASNYYFKKGESDRAIEQAKMTLEMDPNFRPAHVYLANHYTLMGMFEEALREFKLIDYEGPEIGFAYAKMGRISETKRVLENKMRQSRQSYVPYFDIARLYFYLEDKDNGFAYLERSYEEREFGMISLKVNSYIEKDVRTDPRFKELLKRMNLQ